MRKNQHKNQVWINFTLLDIWMQQRKALFPSSLMNRFLNYEHPQRQGLTKTMQTFLVELSEHLDGDRLSPSRWSFVFAAVFPSQMVSVQPSAMSGEISWILSDQLCYCKFSFRTDWLYFSSFCSQVCS